VFAIRERLGCYRFFTHPAQIIEKRVLRRDPQALRDLVVLYVERLAEVARRHPFQWHNLYPYWEESWSRPSS
jgi:predicted LPLAT superfamily acyltransferase